MADFDSQIQPSQQQDQTSINDKQQNEYAQEKSDLIEAGLKPDTVFDLPSALLELQKAFGIINDLRGQLSNAEQRIQEYEIVDPKQKDRQHERLGFDVIQLEQRNLNLEQQILELVEQRKVMKEEMDNLKHIVDYRTQKYNTLKQSDHELEDQVQSL